MYYKTIKYFPYFVMFLLLCAFSMNWATALSAAESFVSNASVDFFFLVCFICVCCANAIDVYHCFSAKSRFIYMHFNRTEYYTIEWYSMGSRLERLCYGTMISHTNGDEKNVCKNIWLAHQSKRVLMSQRQQTDLPTTITTHGMCMCTMYMRFSVFYELCIHKQCVIMAA